MYFKLNLTYFTRPQGSRNFRSVKQTIKRLEEAALSCRGTERAQLLRRWLVVLKEIEKFSQDSSEVKPRTPDQQLSSDDSKDSPKRPSMVSIHKYAPNSLLCSTWYSCLCWKLILKAIDLLTLRRWLYC